MKLVTVEDFKIDSADGDKMVACLPAFNVEVTRKKESELGPDSKPCIEVKIKDINARIDGAAAGIFGAISNIAGGLTLYFLVDVAGANVLSTYSTALVTKDAGVGGWDITYKELDDTWQSRSDTVKLHLEKHLEDVFPNVWKFNLDGLHNFLITNIYRRFLEGQC